MILLNEEKKMFFNLVMRVRQGKILSLHKESKFRPGEFCFCIYVRKPLLLINGTLRFSEFLVRE